MEESDKRRIQLLHGGMATVFGNNLKHLNDCREKLKDKFNESEHKEALLSISATIKSEDDNNTNNNATDENDDGSNGGDQSKPVSLPQQERTDGTTVRTFDCLYDAAEKVHGKFKTVIQRMAKENVERDPAFEIKYVDLKDRSRAESKAIVKYAKRIPGPACSWIYDLIRCSIICYNPEQIIYCIDWLQTNYKVVRVKNRFQHPNHNGYRDVLVYIQVPDETYTFCHICEVQLHIIFLWELSNHLDSYISHQYFRNLFVDHNRSHHVDDAVNKCIEDMNIIFTGYTGDEEEPIDHDHLTVMSSKCDDVLRLSTAAQALAEYFGEFGLAIQLLERAVLAQTGPEHALESATTWEKIAYLKLCQGEMQESLDRYHCALDIQNESLGENHPHVCITLDHIASILAEQEKLDEALQYFQLALDIQSLTLGEDHPDTATSMMNMSSILHEEGYLNQALQKAQKALKSFKLYLRQDHHYIIDTLLILASVRYSQDQMEESIDLCKEALEMAKRSKGETDVTVAEILYKMAMAERESDHRQQALELFENALAIYQMNHDARNPKCISTKRQVQRLQYAIAKDEQEEVATDAWGPKKNKKKKKKRNGESSRCIIS
ncbi:unnamed protein product [Cylindrotheca closterium]|uniref:Kinesin light chain n=1 Tax=Cylindrotheca closterium TaxID=2856 RepID=A0AAD2FK64_9STRA|nr:unnamed protein product [Cylindrotheca closterium]